MTGARHARSHLIGGHQGGLRHRPGRQVAQNAQAAGLRYAIDQLGVLRMMKVTLKNPNVDIAVARQVTAEVLADIQTLGAQL